MMIILPIISANDCMPFSSVPRESKNQINKAGEILANIVRRAKKEQLTMLEEDEVVTAWDLVAGWRACHAYPINTFQSTLRTKTRNLSKDPIVAQRLKRMPTIIDKLSRYPSMTLTQMQDIGGLRAILQTVTQTETLAKHYCDNPNFEHELVHYKNYIENPRDEDGYRSIHLIYKYKNKKNPDYDGLRLELQIRSRLQHLWATAVETMGTSLGQALKSRQGDQEWIDFFAIISSAFAHIESRPPVPRFQKLSKEQTFKAVAESDKELRGLSRMQAFSAAASHIKQTKGNPQFYHLIVLDSFQGTVDVRPYDRDSFKEAASDYLKIEAEAAKGKKIEPVLVSAGSFDQIKRAYPNFFLDVGEFVNVVKKILDAADNPDKLK